MNKRHIRAAAAALLLVVAAVVSLGIHTRSGAVFFADYKPLHLGAQCLVDRCDPYSAQALATEAHRRNEPMPRPIEPEAPVYPPSALLLAEVLSPLGWPLGGTLFASISMLALGAAFGATASRLNDTSGLLVCLAFLVGAGFQDALQFANPAAFALALTVLALVFNEGRRTAVSGILLGLGLALKPQIAMPVAVFFLLRRQSRRTAILALTIAATLLILGTAWTWHATGGLGFLQELTANAQLSAQPGHSTDPFPANEESFSFLNLQPLFARAGLQPNVFALTLTAFVAVLAFTREPRPQTLLALLTLCCLLPIYHREYDRVAALLLIPAITKLQARYRLAYAATLILWLTSDLLFEHILRRFEFLPWTPALTLALTAILLLSLYLPAAKNVPNPVAS